MAAKLTILLARELPVAVILRRGPSHQVLLVRWDLERDTFEAGQWLKGRIDGYRCDLSPHGDLFVYFAVQHTRVHSTWTAISRPPYLTALALWPLGDTWSGGGVFLSPSRLLLEHPEEKSELAEGFTVPDSFEVQLQPLEHLSVFGDGFAKRMVLGGWRQEQKGYAQSQTLKPTEIWSKPSPVRPAMATLRLTIQGFGSARHPRTYELSGEPQGFDLGPADWCPSGDLLLARNGKIYRLVAGSRSESAPAGFVKELIDLSPLTFEGRPAPPEALLWSGPPPQGVPLEPSAHTLGAEDLQSVALRALLARR